jgi:hypothetical protein
MQKLLSFDFKQYKITSRYYFIYKAQENAQEERTVPST